jgi:hypothetical protein
VRAVSEPSHQGPGDGEAEERHLPVPAGGSPEPALPARGEVVDAPRGVLERLGSGPLAAPALAAAGGFLVGFVTFVTGRLLRARGRRGLLAGRRRRSLERRIESSRSFLVDVHVLRR